MPGYGGGPWGNGGLGGGDVALTIWDYAASKKQQRIQPANFTPDHDTYPFPYALSSWKFVLGSDGTGRKRRANVGDYVELAQTADWAANVLRAIVQVRPPVLAQAGVTWALTMTVDGITWDTFTFVPGSPERTLWTLGARGGALGPTPHAWAFRLTLMSLPTPPIATSPAPHPAAQVVLNVANATSPASPLPIVVQTTAPHGLLTGDSVLIASVGGNTAANGYRHVTVVDTTHFSLNGVFGNGAYTSGGTVTTPPNVPVTSSQTSTTVAAGSNGVALSTFLGSGILHVASTATFQTVGQLIFPGHGNAVVSYTGTSGGNAFTGCTLVSGSGTLATGDSVTSYLNAVVEVELPGVYVAFVLEDNA